MRDIPRGPLLGLATACVLACHPLAPPPVVTHGDRDPTADAEVWNLGVVAAGGTYPTTLSAANASCPGRHDFEVRVEDTPWLRVTGPRRLNGVARGETKPTTAEVDLTTTEPGELRGTVVVRCLDCPHVCHPHETAFEVRLTAVAAADDGASGGGSGGAGPSSGDAPGDRFRWFLELAEKLVIQTSRDALVIQPQDDHARAALEAVSRIVHAHPSELRELSAATRELTPEAQSKLDGVVVEGAPEVLQSTTAGSARAPKLQLQLDGQGNELAATITRKGGELLGNIPLVGSLVKLLADDVAELFEGASEMAVILAGMALAEHELELKLDTMVGGLFGVSIDESSNERELRELLRQVPSGALPRRLEELERRLEERLEQVDRRQSVTQHKVDELALEVGTSLRGVRYEVEPDAVKPRYDGPDPSRHSVLDQVELLRLKIDNLARILGLSLYGPEMGFPSGFDVEPPDPHDTAPPGAGPEYPAIKPEIENLEGQMEKVIERLKRIEHRQDGGPGGGGPGDPLPPPPPPPPPDQGSSDYEAIAGQLALTKKIYVYEEGVFRAENADDREEIVVRTAAFDLAGWLDLTSLRDGDEVAAVVEVSVAGGPYRPWSRTVFRGAQERGLKYFTEIAEGLQEVVGTNVRITLSQPRSTDRWQTPVAVGYQLIVESQD